MDDRLGHCDGEAYAAFWRAYRGGQYRSVRDSQTILRIVEAQRRRKIHNHQNADWAAGADVRTHATAGAGFFDAFRRGQAPDWRCSRRDGTLRAPDRGRIFEFCRPDVWTRPRHYPSAYARVAGIYAACGPTEIHDRRLFSRHAEKARAGRSGDSRAAHSLSG